MDSPISQEVIRVVESARGPAVKLPNWAVACRWSASSARSKETLDKPFGNDEQRKSYKQSIVTSSATKQEIHMECEKVTTCPLVGSWREIAKDVQHEVRRTRGKYAD